MRDAQGLLSAAEAWNEEGGAATGHAYEQGARRPTRPKHHPHAIKVHYDTASRVEPRLVREATPDQHTEQRVKPS